MRTNGGQNNMKVELKIKEVRSSEIRGGLGDPFIQNSVLCAFKIYQASCA